MFSCSRCGETVTVPYFFRGGVYGYTCITLINPAAKRQPAKYLEVSRFTVQPVDSRGNVCFKAFFKGYEHKGLTGFMQPVGESAWASGGFIYNGCKLYVESKTAVKYRIGTI